VRLSTSETDADPERHGCFDVYGFINPVRSQLRGLQDATTLQTPVIFTGDIMTQIRIDHWLVAIFLFIMASIAFLNVLSRYLFHFSISSTEEITINLFVWVTVIGSGLAFERGGQLGMVTLYNIFPNKLKKTVTIANSAASTILFILVDYYMIQAIYNEITLFQATSPALAIPVWIYYAGVPIFSIFVFIGIYRHSMAKLKLLDYGN
jgi:TRAP-type transport system small permease protein